jgi:hypothetical protein
MAMIFWLVYLLLIGFLVVSAVVVFKADITGPSKIVQILIAVMLVYGFYKLKYPAYTYRYRMTVEVDAGGETRSGSSVTEVTATRVPQFLPEVIRYERSLEGQAIFIALPDGKNIVALLASGAVAIGKLCAVHFVNAADIRCDNSILHHRPFGALVSKWAIQRRRWAGCFDLCKYA